MSHYRILTLTCVIYRLWAKYRCSQLDPIFKPWALDGLITAGPGQGAADGHYAFAVRLEHAIVHQHPFAGGVTDLSQCFDRILRQQMYPIAIKAGIPSNIIMAYDRHARNITYTNHYPTGYGRLRNRTCSIAQGCPWAMRFLAIITHPWILKMKSINIIPRVLADDLMIYATGLHSTTNTALALLLTHEYILDIRGMVKTEKHGPLHMTPSAGNSSEEYASRCPQSLPY
jgi:hypothetical protein